ncbi:MAG: hypothetical protein HY791_13685 [Deltaproteobacteria bacterium]|nr:hypothetical protein [Deltaproteobacteria bacterium]
MLIRGIKECGAYQDAVSLAEADPRVANMLGAPVEPSWYVTGSVSLSNDDGEADLAIPFRGSKSEVSATLHVIAEKKAGVWKLRRSDLSKDSGGEVIDLLVPAPM